VNVQETTGYMLVQVARAHRARAQELLAEHGLHPGQEILLMHLCDHDGQMHSELADKMDVTAPTISKIVDRMEAAGLVCRRADPDDQRVSRVYKTDTARRLQSKIEAAWAELERQSFANFTTDERVILRRLLMQMLANLS
jgi:DNA-binding MarR family transcriptional regulator